MRHGLVTAAIRLAHDLDRVHAERADLLVGARLRFGVRGHGPCRQSLSSCPGGLLVKLSVFFPIVFTAASFHMASQAALSEASCSASFWRMTASQIALRIMSRRPASRMRRRWANSHSIAI